MGRKKKATEAPQLPQDVAEVLDPCQDLNGPDTLPGEVENEKNAAEALDPYQDLSGPGAVPDEVEDVGTDAVPLGGLEDEAGGPEGPMQYAVSARPGLNLREGPSKAAPILTELPCGVGVFRTGLFQGPWWEVSTGRLTGWVLAEFLEFLGPVEPVWEE